MLSLVSEVPLYGSLAGTARLLVNEAPRYLAQEKTVLRLPFHHYEDGQQTALAPCVLIMEEFTKTNDFVTD